MASTTSQGKKLNLYSRRGQFVLVLLAALEDLDGEMPSKTDVAKHVEKQGYLNITRELQGSYSSKSEPIWQTELAYARRDANDKGWLSSKQRDVWEIGDEGKDVLKRMIERFGRGEFTIDKLEFLSPLFFLRMHVPSK